MAFKLEVATKIIQEQLSREVKLVLIVEALHYHQGSHLQGESCVTTAEAIEAAKEEADKVVDKVVVEELATMVINKSTTSKELGSPDHLSWKAFKCIEKNMFNEMFK